MADVNFHYPDGDAVTRKWLEQQDSPSFSMRMIIREYIRQNGYTDPTCLDFVYPETQCASAPTDSMAAECQTMPAQPVVPAADGAASRKSISCVSRQKKKNMPPDAVTKAKMETYLQEHDGEPVNRQFTDAFNREFDTSYSVSTITTKRTRWRKKAGIASYPADLHITASQTQRIDKFLTEHYGGTVHTSDFNETCGTNFTTAEVSRIRYVWSVLREKGLHAEPDFKSRKAQAVTEISRSAEHFNQAIAEHGLPLDPVRTPALKA